MFRKEDLISLLEQLNIPINLGVQSDENANKLPRIVLMEMLWNDIQASGSSSDTVVRYQISFFAKAPRDSKLLELRKLLIEKNIPVEILHEFINEPVKQIHSFMAIDVVEKLDE